jgi:methylated-DNA-[protein]-cysteine S-methyltransferase
MSQINLVQYNSPLGILNLLGSLESIQKIEFEKASSTNTIIIENSGSPSWEANAIEQLTAYFEGNLKSFNLPVEIKGTEFQLEVWNKLSLIPYGGTISYKELALQLGNLKSIRAAASANGRNPLPILVPCHRVIGSQGELVGYSGELWRKKWLLEHESRIRWGTQTLF